MSSVVLAAPAPVPQTVMPSSRAASRSNDALFMPVVISSRRSGNDSRTVRGNGVRSRIATTTSNPRRR